MKHFLLVTLLLFTAATPTLSDTADDAAFVVDAHLDATNAKQDLAALSQQVLIRFRPALESVGAEILDDARFVEAMVGDFYDDIFFAIRQRWLEAYQTHLTPKEINELADFYRTPDGQALLAMGFTETALDRYESFFTEGPGAPIMEHASELEKTKTVIETETNARIAEIYTPDRLASVLAMQDIVYFEDEAKRRALVDGLREKK